MNDRDKIGAASLLLGPAIGGKIGKILGGRSARKARKRARRLRESQAQIANVRARRQAAAALRSQQAQQAIAALVTGSAGSSGVLGATSSLEAQATDAVTMQRIAENTGVDINKQNQRAAAADQLVQDVGAVQGFAQTALQAATGNLND